MTSEIEDEENNYTMALSLSLYGLRIHPDEATKTLGIQPSTSRAIGETGRIIGKK